MDLKKIASDVREAANMLVDVAEPSRCEILVLGASTSEIQGENIGSSGDEAVAGAVFDSVYDIAREAGLYVAAQCCEHLNRALVVEKEILKHYNLKPVTVLPSKSAGGVVAYRAAQVFDDALVVESISGHLGLDIGDTFIGMHLRPVVVPVRIHKKSIGNAHLTMARNRPPLIGGKRAEYPDDPHGKKVRYPDCKQ